MIYHFTDAEWHGERPVDKRDWQILAKVLVIMSDYSINERHYHLDLGNQRGPGTDPMCYRDAVAENRFTGAAITFSFQYKESDEKVTMVNVKWGALV